MGVDVSIASAADVYVKVTGMRLRMICAGTVVADIATVAKLASVEMGDFVTSRYLHIVMCKL